MRSYRIRKLVFRAMIALPAPAAFDRLLRRYVLTRAGQQLYDPSVNGEYRLLDAHGPACRILFDVGAHRGKWTEHALQTTPDARIHCFEPIQAYYRTLVERGFPPRVTCNACGLSDVPGRAEIFTRSLSLHDRRGPGRGGAAEGAVEPVELTTLEAYCTSHGIDEIDFLKVDAEGHDLAVLRGGARMIREGRIRRIQFEYGPCNIFARVFLRDFFLFFEGLPYTIHEIMPRALVPVSTYDVRLENLQYTNFVALHHSVSA